MERSSMETLWDCRLAVTLLAATLLNGSAADLNGQARQGNSARQGNPARQAQQGNQVTPVRTAPVQRTADNSSQQAPQGVAPRKFAAPSWYPLTPKHQGYLDEILTYWEYHCKSINYYECDFLHFVYGPTREQNGGRLPNGNYPALEKHEGIIKYSEPDKAMYQTTKVFGFDPSLPKKYAERDVERFGNHWVCDGKAVYDFNYTQKKLFVDILPPEAQGKAIDRGPLPFLFRAKKDDLQKRFWIRVITPKNVKEEYWLEVVPKFQSDAAYFQFAHIIIAEKDYLPQAIVLFDPAYNPGNPKKQTYIFQNRRTNWTWKDKAKGLLLWQKQFYEPKVPRGWEKVERQSGTQQQPPEAAPRTAQRNNVSGGTNNRRPVNTQTGRSGTIGGLK